VERKPIDRRRIPPRPKEVTETDTGGNDDSSDSDNGGTGTDMTPQRRRNVGGNPKLKT
jgi:hypothetical protein